MRFTNFLTDEAALNEIGERIARLRLERNWTQADLAEAAGVSKSTIERLENGSSTQLSNLLRALRALGTLENLERTIPPSQPSPIELLEHQGRTRQRVRNSLAATSLIAKPAWSWGES
ncbi:MAG: helix-turn-helix transcriptional regulator [Phenylobacterium sp.]|uniref:helix-turn-helix domain-containing protein n=1 Tax=Alphaproteobacteria TaxID=28211 RepID=UPI001B51CD64|nr:MULTISPECIES: helix-turn-helix transcriptional regulator [Alphaproteobacteria]MBP7815527.1 helix-turn-helix transcriptional regulator [Phenylobacterium sp.]MBP8235809.1 helix-turn-helix transcriptional regulator [Rhizorhabdus sp.]MBP9754590.1 helix-turn-helix transcriptional regulator [Phenylobacterium sp.]